MRCFFHIQHPYTQSPADPLTRGAFTLLPNHHSERWLGLVWSGSQVVTPLQPLLLLPTDGVCPYKAGVAIVSIPHLLKDQDSVLTFYCDIFDFVDGRQAES